MVSALTEIDRALLAALEPGLPACPEPYERLGRLVGLSECAVLERLKALREEGTISRFGVVVRHRELGYRANAMVVWDIPDDRVRKAGKLMAGSPCVTLCYRRPRRLPAWPYNLFCMIHGRNREAVLRQVEEVAELCDLVDTPSAVLFSARCFKQRGAKYGFDTKANARLDDTDRAIVDRLQVGFPVCKQPYQAAAQTLGLTEEVLIARLSRLLERGVLSRFGPLYDAEKLGGAVTLVAMAVPETRFDAVAEQVNAHPEVAHNYARDHALNMWFVIACDKSARIDALLGEIAAETGLTPISLPKEEEYFLDLKLSA